MKYSAFLTAMMATPALAHNGAHVHLHNGASWLVMAAALAVLLGAGSLALATRKAKS